MGISHQKLVLEFAFTDRMEGGPRWLDFGPWSLIRPTTSVVCSLADRRALGPYSSTVTVSPVICRSAQVELFVSSLSRNRSDPSAEFPSAVTRNL
jgi:hypothetical protein